MKYGKIRIEDGNLIFTKHMILNYLPCKDIVWAYKRRESIDNGGHKHVMTNYLMIYTQQQKKYMFDMTEREVQECITLLKALNPEMAIGFPKGARIALQSMPNTRDLGALTTADGRHIRPRKVIRSGSLYHLSQADRELLMNEYHLKTVIDFRTLEEREEMPDSIIRGVEYYHLPITEENLMGICRSDFDPLSLGTKLGTRGSSKMEKQYEKLILDDFSLKQIARFLDLLRHHDNGAILWHGTLGKDRTGIATAIFLSILGVPDKTIKEDFLKSNQYLEENSIYMTRYLENKTIVDSKLLQGITNMYSVKEAYINKVFRLIRRKYGGMTQFAKKELYVSAKMVEELQNKYLI